MVKLSTSMIHEGVDESDRTYGSVVVPIYPTSTYIFPDAKEGARRFAGTSKGMIYSRFTNPTVSALEKRLAVMEGAESAVATSSGMSAVVTTMLHLLKQGDTIVAHKAVYGGVFEFFSRILPRFGITVRFTDFADIKGIAKLIDKTTKIIYFESPTNPLLEIFDIKAITNLARKNKLLTVFDNTFTPSPFQAPIKLGVDVVIHSLTKYISGHSDVIGGVIIGKKKLLEEIAFKSFAFLGSTLSPFAAYLALRGLTTLDIRYRKQSESAAMIARFLQKHPKVARVYYPGLPMHPRYKIARRQMKEFGGVLAFELKGGYKAGEKLVNSVQVIRLAVSLGSVVSLIEHPASMTHSELTPEERTRAEISEGLIRFSVGLEDTGDLIDDLAQALRKL